MSQRLRIDHAPRCSKSTRSSLWTLLALVLGLCFQDVPRTANAGTPDPASENPIPAQSTPDPKAVAQVFQIAERAVLDWTPLGPKSFAELAPATDEFAEIHGLHIQLRHDGRVIGRCASLTASLPAKAEDRAAAVHELIRSCVNSVLVEAEGRVDLPNDALRDQNLRTLAKGMRLSVECAGPPAPIAAKTWADAIVELDPGVHGVAVLRKSDGSLPAVFPSAMLARGLLPGRTLSGVIAQTVGEGGAAAALDEPAAIQAKHGLMLLRFKCSHLAHPYGTGDRPESPVFLTRGSRLAPIGEITLANLRADAQAAADHLSRRLQPLSQGRPAAGVFEPWMLLADAKPAEAHELALAAVSLAEFASLPDQPKSVASSAAASAELAIRGTVSGLGDKPDTSEARVVVSLALLIVAVDRLDQPQLQAPTQAHTQRLAEWWSAASQHAITPQGSFETSVPTVTRGLIAYALALTSRAPETRARADAAVSAAFASVTPDQRVALMPWLAYATEALADSAPADQPPLAALPGSIALRDMRSRIWLNQLGLADAGASAPDLVGGIVFTAGGGSPLPTWQCFRPIAGLASMLPDSRLTDADERTAEAARLGSALRFVRQLQVDEFAAWSALSPRQVIGGFRASAWDHSMPLDASSFGLLTFTEAVRAFSTATGQHK